MKTIFFGGAFDPFHEQHRTMIIGAKKELNADRVIVYPSFLPPHKADLYSSFEIRMQMTLAGTKGIPDVFIDTIERDRDVVNYSYEVIPLLKKKYPSDEYYFLIGGDSMVHFGHWVRPDIIAKEITIAVVNRQGVPGLEDAIERARLEYGAKVILLETQGENVSSSAIKARAELGLEQKDICPDVRKIVVDNNLYRIFSEIVEKARTDMPKKTFDHVCRTVMYAIKVNTKLNLPYKEVFLSCLLHDCAKHEKAEMEGVPAPVVHQYTGAEKAKAYYGINDENILSAIRYHTTGKPDMTTLEKLVFCADMLEEGRDYPGVDYLRQTIESDFEKGFRECVRCSLNHLIENKKPFDPLTKSCASYYTII